jgi:hypothetical protein
MRLYSAEYGFNVTIGIAAKTVDQRHIITVSDRRLSFGDDAPASENAILKDHVIYNGWGALFAANDTSYAVPILQQAAWILTEKKHEATLLNVRKAMCEAYAAVLNDYISRVVLRKFGFENVQEPSEDVLKLIATIDIPIPQS